MFEHHQSINNQLTVGHWNCNSITTKQLPFNKFISENKFDLFSLNETKLDDRNKKTLEFYNYNIETRNRNRNGGGVAILIKKNLEYTVIQELNNLDFEILGVTVQLVNTSINVIISTYRQTTKRIKEEIN